MRLLHPCLLALLLSSSLAISCSHSSSKETGNSKSRAEASAQAEKDSSYVVDVIAVDYAYGMPAEVPSGWVTFRMKNKGKHEHNAIIHKFPDSLGYNRLNRLVVESIGNETKDKWRQLQSLSTGAYGGPATVSSGGTAETSVFLEPGIYVYTCWMTAPDGMTHAENGMQRVFKVTSENSGSTKPQGTIDLTVSDFAIKIEDPIEAGEQIFDVNFQDSHNLHLARIEQDQDVEDLKKWMKTLQTPSPFTFLGGAEPVPPGTRSSFKATLKPGRYALLTYGMVNTGMVAEFTVPAEGKAFMPDSEGKHPRVTVEMHAGSMNVPDRLPVGLTSFVVTNNESDSHHYIFFQLKKGKTAEDMFTFFTQAFVDRTINPREVEWPAYDLGSELLEPGSDHSFDLNVLESDYVFMGPLAPGGPRNMDWNMGLLHLMRGVAE